MKFDTLMARLETEVFAVEPNFSNALLDDLKSYRDNKKESHTEIANNSVTYQVIGENAVIALDGVMYKKDLKICTDVVSYEQIISKIDMAEADENVKNIIFRVDTNGGSVAGAEEVRTRIKNSPKHTITFFENIGASGGMWIFTASDEVYSAPLTQLGSIGVIVIYQGKKSDTKAIVSSNAPNKYCDISTAECKNRIQEKLDKYESVFLDVLIEAYPNKTRNKIIEDFDRGATIFAETAYKLGYLDGVMQFNDLLSLKKTVASMPSTEKMVNNDKEGIDMANENKNEMTVESLQSELAMRDTTIEALQSKVDGGEVKIAKMLEEIAELKEAIVISERKFEIATYAVAMGMERGASKDVILNAMTAEDKLKAGDVIAEAIMSNGATTIGEKQIRTSETEEKEGLALKAELRRKGELQ
jgi:ClpP class serine protease